MKSRHLILAAASAALALCASAALAESPVGAWSGTVKAGEGMVPVAVTIAQAADGSLSGTSRSPRKKGGAPVKLEKVTSDGKTLSFDAPEAGGGFKGAWNEEKKAWVGRWASEDGPLDMVLMRAK